MAIFLSIMIDVAGAGGYYCAPRQNPPNGLPDMSDTLPDRLSTNPNSPFYDEDVLKRGVGIRFNGAEKTNVDEYSVSEGWIRVVAGNAKDRQGNPMTIKLKGKVEPYVRAPEEDSAAR